MKSPNPRHERTVLSILVSGRSACQEGAIPLSLNRLSAFTVWTYRQDSFWEGMYALKIRKLLASCRAASLLHRRRIDTDRDRPLVIANRMHSKSVMNSVCESKVCSPMSNWRAITPMLASKELICSGFCQKWHIAGVQFRSITKSQISGMGVSGF